jgi:hypothetical protein
MSNFKIDFFELMFLAEVCIPPTPIARAVFFENLSNIYYNQMSDDERKRAFEWITKKENFKLASHEEDCQLFYARFNPDNQYRVSCFYNGKREVHDCFKFNNKYHISKTTSICEEYIKSVEKFC